MRFQAQGHLLMIHSMMDDNVHPPNTMQLLTAFTNAARTSDADPSARPARCVQRKPPASDAGELRLLTRTGRGSCAGAGWGW